MHFTSLNHFLSEGTAALAKGPIALILLEDDVEVGSSIRHHLDAGFKSVVTFGVSDIVLPDDLPANVHRVDFDATVRNAQVTIVNAVIEKAPGQWLYYCYNTEYIFFPFCEHRAIGEMLAFHTEERRDAVLTYVVDLYAGDLHENPTAVSLDDAYMDKSGYYALARKDAQNEFADRQLDFFGGLRWRFEEHVPALRRRIDRISIFRAKPGLRLRTDHTFNDAEYNTYACPWHHSITAALVSFRTAKALKRNPVSAAQISTFKWHNSTPFEWHSQQLLNLGLMEPGQWF
ncbi:MAG: hypothetical protein KC448_07295 [Yoonia sp.]|nr:hypothetical protein [Yoonia sp.]